MKVERPIPPKKLAVIKELNRLGLQENLHAKLSTRNDKFHSGLDHQPIEAVRLENQLRRRFRFRRYFGDGIPSHHHILLLIRRGLRRETVLNIHIPDGLSSLIGFHGFREALKNRNQQALTVLDISFSDQLFSLFQ